MAFDGSSSACVRSTAQSVPASFQSAHTVGGFVKASVAPSTSSAFDIAFGTCGGALQEPQANVHWDHTSGTFYKTYARRGSNNSYYPAQFASTPPVGSWFHLIAAFDGSVSRVYINGVLDGTSGSGPTGSAQSAWTTLLGGVNSGGSYESGTSFLVGEVAEVGFWDALLDADEMNALVKGFRPSRVRPAKLQTYYPGVRELTELRKGGASLVNGTLVLTPHPRVYG